MAEQRLRGAELVIKALVDQGVDTIFGYPGGAVLPIYDALFKQNAIRHVLVRHEQGAVHAAEGYARSTGKPGVVLVTSGPGATNAVTGLADAMMDSIPIVCITGQVATHLIGNDAFQEADTVGITRPVTKHNWLVKSGDDVARVMHEAFYVATNGRPGPVVVDLPKDIQIAMGDYVGPANVRHKTYRPQVKGDRAAIEQALEAMAKAKRPLFYTGGGVVNAGPAASLLLTELVQATGYPITNTLMGLGTYPANDKQFLGLVGMHGTYKSNMSMYECDVMICIGARFDDRVTGKTDEFSPNSLKIHVDIDRSSINKNIAVDIPIIGDAGLVLEDMIKIWKSKGYQPDKKALAEWWKTIDKWREKDSLKYTKRKDEIMPQHAIQRLYRADSRQGSDHHDRGRPAPDVGGAVLRIPEAEPVADLRRSRHHGLWPAGGDRRAGRQSAPSGHRCRGRSLDHDEHSGAFHRRSARSAGQGVHREQPVYGHGPAVAGHEL